MDSGSNRYILEIRHPLYSLLRWAVLFEEDACFLCSWRPSTSFRSQLHTRRLDVERVILCPTQIRKERRGRQMQRISSTPNHPSDHSLPKASAPRKGIWACSKQRSHLVIKLSTYSIRYYDIQASQPIYTILDRSLAIGHYTNILWIVIRLRNVIRVHYEIERDHTPWIMTALALYSCSIFSAVCLARSRFST